MRDQKDSENAETAKQEHRRLLERPGECFVNWTALQSYKDPSTGTPAVSLGFSRNGELRCPSHPQTCLELPFTPSHS